MEEKTWGMRFNEHPNYERFKKGQKPQNCPEWLNPAQVNTWQEQGLIVWNNTDKKIERLSGSDALRLLDELTSQDNWKSEGVSITHLVHEIQVGLPPRGRHKKAAPEPKPEPKSSKTEPVYKEFVHLPQDAGPALIELLQINKHIFTEMAEEEKKRVHEGMKILLETLSKFHHRQEQSEFDFESRSFKWERIEEARWSCQYQEVEGRVLLERNQPQLFWHACVRRPNFIGKSNRFVKFQEAIEWVEREIVDLANQPAEVGRQSQIHPLEQIEADRIRLTKKLISGPYWIDPTAIEPKNVTYQIFIILEANPVEFKTSESMCGETFRYNERYLSPSKQAASLSLAIDHFDVRQPIGENSDLFHFISLTTYYQETSVAEQAQKVWDQSQILQQFKAGKISRARYGYREVETGFATYLGACENPEKLWGQHESRKEHIELKALRESLCFALDVNDYRDYLGLSSESMSDGRILMAMHKNRARSKYLSEEIKRESKVWLAQHESLEDGT